ncbi:hypothetical protein DYB30_004247 [Aphanomyces astaci]|uniref:Temptin Cys/Cys disulfide domain-containing protein n=1 Tax=Aphanomyces astaci TaxID=112090 RepID=A0A397DQY4_APHAT|nr:hypothetical protein DYB30_004247 [Aphanomyces astaci]
MSIVELAMAFKTALILGLAISTTGFPKYVAKVPNGDKVAGVEALGHVNPAGGGARNAFGAAFKLAGATWTTGLCQADSDNDGATNGDELGDPCCTWKVGEKLATAKATHPGEPDIFTPDQLNALKCGVTALEDGTTTNPVPLSAPPSKPATAPSPLTSTLAVPSTTNKPAASHEPMAIQKTTASSSGLLTVSGVAIALAILQ